MKQFIKKKLGILGVQNLIIKNKEQLNIIERKTDEIYWSNVFNNSISDSSWLINKSFNPGRWAAGYPMLYILFRVYDMVKPHNIIEFGLGESSKITYQYNQHFKDSKYLIIEQDNEWLDFFSSQIFNVKKNTSILKIKEQKVHDNMSKVYENLQSVTLDNKYDLIIVDGPHGSLHYSRYQIVDLIKSNNLADDFIIIIDDYDRNGEKETVNEIFNLFKNNNINYVYGIYTGIKETIIICSEKFKFLASL